MSAAIRRRGAGAPATARPAMVIRPEVVVAGEPPIGSITILDVLVLWVALSSLAGMALLWAHHFRSVSTAAIGVVLVTAVLSVARVGITSPRWRWRPLGVIAGVIGAATRIDRYPHLSGGQDQGLYTNMAIQMRRTGSVLFGDRLRTRLSGEALALYDRYLPIGLHVDQPATSLLTIDFYPLHPMWMAMFGSTFGDTRQTMSLLFFAALAALLAMGIAGQLAPGTDAPLLVGLLVAVNPVLAFFSKFPVSETVASAFALAGFHHLLRACGHVAPRVRAVHVVTSVASFGALCFVRFQLFLYLPFFALLVMVACTRYLVAATRRVIFVVVLASVALLQISLVFYRDEQLELYRGAMSSITPYIRPAMIAAAALASALVLGVYALIRNRGRWHAVDRLVELTLRRSGLLLVLSLLSFIPSILELYRTGEMQPWHYLVDTDDAWLIRYSVLWRFALFVGPTGLFVIVGLVLWRRMPRQVSASVVFLATCWLGVLLQPYVPYLYYYGRYLIVDILPLTLILCAVVAATLAQGGRRTLARVIVGSMVVCALPFSLLQIGDVEGESLSIAHELAERLGDEDLVVFPATNELIALSLKVAYDKQVTVVPDPSPDATPAGFALDDIFEVVRGRGGRVFLARPTPSDDPWLRLELTSAYRMGWLTNTEHTRDGTFQSGSRRRLLLPTSSKHWSPPYYVYEVAPEYFDRLACSGAVEYGDPIDSELSVGGVDGAEPQGRWVGTTSYVGCLATAGVRPATVTIEVLAANVTADHPQRLVVAIDGITVGETTFTAERPAGSIQVAVPAEALQPDGQLDERVDISLSAPDAATQPAIGSGTDPRVLGVFIGSVAFG